MLLERKREGGMDHLLEGLNLSKSEKKKLEKLNKINIHLYALFAAVEHGQVDKVRTILETGEMDVNSGNSDNLTPLDIAVLSHNLPMARILMAHGAKEGPIARSGQDCLKNHVTLLSEEAERQMALESVGASQGMNSGGSSITKEWERRLACWDRRTKLLRKMVVGFEQMRPPDPPQYVTLDVIGANTVRLSFPEPEHTSDSTCTKVKVQWSFVEDFSMLGDEREICDRRKSEVVIPHLTQGTRYYFRIACGNMSGYGGYQVSKPTSAVPSSWTEVDGRKPRYSGRIAIIEELFSEVQSSRPDLIIDNLNYQSNGNSIFSSTNHTPGNQRRNQTKGSKIVSIKQLFTATPKFLKNFKRGVFLASLMYSDDRLLVTTEEVLPVVEVDEAPPSSLHQDFHWLMQVACTGWNDVKIIRQDIEKSQSCSSLHFKSKLMQAASHMQSCLGVQDLGQLHYRPIVRDGGIIVLCAVRYIKSPKASLSPSLNVKWIPISKVISHWRPNNTPVANAEDPSPSEQLMSSIQDQVSFHQSSSSPLPKGLYLTYLKMQSSLEKLHILVSDKTPNFLPHCRIRENSHVSCEEWEWLRNLSQVPNQSSVPSTPTDEDSPFDAQLTILSHSPPPLPCQSQLVFERQVTSAARKLLAYLDVEDMDADAHRLYIREVIEVCPDVSLLILIPPAEQVCSAPGQEEICSLNRREDLLPLPLQAFEMLHLSTYQHNFIARYSRLTCLLEMDILLAQHQKREAFSTEELLMAKKRVDHLQVLQKRCEAAWKSSRWLHDIISYARDKTDATVSNGVLLKVLLQRHLINVASRSDFHSSNDSLTGNKDLMCKLSRKDGIRRGEFGNKGTRSPLSRSDTRFRKSITSESLSEALDNEIKSNNQQHSNKNTSNQRYRVGGSTTSLTNYHETSHRRSDASVISTASMAVIIREHSKSEQQLDLSDRITDIDEEFSMLSFISNRSQCYDVTENNGRLVTSRSENQLGSCYDRRSPRKVSVPEVHSLMSSVLSIAPSSLGCSPSIRLLKETSRQHSRSDSTIAQNRSTAILLSNSTTSHESSYSIQELFPFSKKRFPSNLSIDSGGGIGCSSASVRSLSSNEHDDTDVPSETDSTKSEISNFGSDMPCKGILQVYAAYDSGLASGTSVRLQVTSRTTSREVVDLVVRQLQQALFLKLKNKDSSSTSTPSTQCYSEDTIRLFCLVAVIGARERCLRDDFKPLQLQNPWRKGKLFVRMKNDVLAALAESSKTTNFL